MRSNTRIIMISIAAVCLALLCSSSGRSEAIFQIGVWPQENGRNSLHLGILSWARAGWDGGPPDRILGDGIALALYREKGPDWAGSTGLYLSDYEPPLVPGESKTWYDIYLWAQNYTPPGNQAVIGWFTDVFPPPGYRGVVALDYVPDALGWSGPMQWEIGMTWQTAANYLTMPVPTVTNPLQGVRLHLTVTAPITEPTTLASLGLGILLLGSIGRMSRSRHNRPSRNDPRPDGTTEANGVE